MLLNAGAKRRQKREPDFLPIFHLVCPGYDIGWRGGRNASGNGEGFGTAGEGGTRLAVWQTGLGGLNWIDDLVKQQKAILLGQNGYPTEYTATAAHVVARLRDGPPEAKAAWTFDAGDIILPGWLGKTTRDPEAIDACRLDEWLIIRAWDES